MNLKQRSYKKELLDQDNIPFEDIKQNMKELDKVNTLLGGHKISIEGLAKLIGDRKKVTICEIGCGGGDNLFALNKWCVKNKIEASFIGVDIKAECIEFAKTSGLQNVTWVVSDYKLAAFNEQPDIIFSSLFCHHFTDEELVFQVKWMKENCTIGFFINDLQRHWLAYSSIKMLTRLFSKSYLVKNDAPLSVARGFKKDEWTRLLKTAGIDNVRIDWKWAFRYLITYKHG